MIADMVCVLFEAVDLILRRKKLAFELGDNPYVLSPHQVGSLGYTNRRDK
jgi:hypothetical protein